MSREEMQRSAAEKLWALLHAEGLSRIEGVRDGPEILKSYEWVVGRLAGDPDFQALVNVNARKCKPGGMS